MHTFSGMSQILRKYSASLKPIDLVKLKLYVTVRGDEGYSLIYLDMVSLMAPKRAEKMLKQDLMMKIVKGQYLLAHDGW